MRVKSPHLIKLSRVEPTRRITASQNKSPYKPTKGVFDFTIVNMTCRGSKRLTVVLA